MASCTLVSTLAMSRILARNISTLGSINGVRSQSTNSSTQNSFTEQMKVQKSKFSPKRSRDTSGAQLSAKVTKSPGGPPSAPGGVSGGNRGGLSGGTRLRGDSHISAYDKTSTCSLSSAMQTTVPQPFKTVGSVDSSRTGHLSMPGGQWAQDDKYISADLQEHHHTTVAQKAKKKAVQRPKIVE